MLQSAVLHPLMGQTIWFLKNICCTIHCTMLSSDKFQSKDLIRQKTDNLIINLKRNQVSRNQILLAIKTFIFDWLVVWLVLNNFECTCPQNCNFLLGSIQSQSPICIAMVNLQVIDYIIQLYKPSFLRNVDQVLVHYNK